jgi:hypothetical protein
MGGTPTTQCPRNLPPLQIGHFFIWKYPNNSLPKIPLGARTYKTLFTKLQNRFVFVEEN